MGFFKLNLAKIIAFSVLVIPVAALAGKSTGPAPLAGMLSVEQVSPALEYTDKLFARLINAESGGKQFSSSGAPLTSVKGAVGKAQVMPGTAPIAARMAGLEWNEQRYRNDAQYNVRLGFAYYNFQLQRYGGNHVLALAAYNAGPGKVDEWLETIGDPRTGKISNSSFASTIPYAETRNYIARILGEQIPAFKGVIPSTASQRFRTISSKYEFKDTQKGFQFNTAVNRSFDSSAKLVGGL